MTIDNRTTNLNLPLPAGPNLLSVDVLRLREALEAIDAAVSARAPLASPGLTGNPTAPTQAVDNVCTRISSTEFVLGQAGTANPVANGPASPGASRRFSRQDHRHPIDTSRAPLASPEFTGAPTAPTPAADSASTRIATTQFVAEGFVPRARQVFASGGLEVNGGPSADLNANITVGTTQGTQRAIEAGLRDGFKNALINGDFIIAQRVATSPHAITNGANYFIDRWRAFTTGANATGQLIELPPGELPRFRYRLSGAAGVTSISVQQLIEQANCLHLAGREVTISVRTRNSLLTTMGWRLDRPNAVNNWSSSTTIASGSWTISGTLNTYAATVILPEEVHNGLGLLLSVGAQTSGQWDLVDVQIELGPLATPFEQRSYGQELALCQRYFCGGPSGATLNVTGATANVSFSTFFPVPMRAVPTITGWPVSFVSNLGWTGFQNVAGLSWAGNVGYSANAEL